jgi:serine/threonine-protein kinase
MICPCCQGDNRRDAETCYACAALLPAGLGPGRLVAGRYRIAALIGSGGMGKVYEARDQRSGAVIALKALFAGRAAKLALQFRAELRLARRIVHPSVCRIFGWGDDGGVSYVVMERLYGVELSRRIAQQGPPPPEEAFELGIQLAGALEAVHETGLLHRDVKSGNVMVDAAGLARLMDFDIAQRVVAGKTSSSASGAVLGTPEYLSPEQALGDPLDARSDLYSLGVVVYELFTGELPFRGSSPVDTLRRHVEEPAPLGHPRIPPALKPVLERLLAKRPELRIPAARQVAAALRMARAAAGSSATAVGSRAG